MNIHLEKLLKKYYLLHGTGTYFGFEEFEDDIGDIQTDDDMDIFDIFDIFLEEVLNMEYMIGYILQDDKHIQTTLYEHSYHYRITEKFVKEYIDVPI